MKKSSLSTILLVLIFVVGLAILLYPSVSDYWNSLHATRAVSNYVEQVATMDNTLYDDMLASAVQYNADLRAKENRYRITEEDYAVYKAQLDVSGTGIIGYIEIPAIDSSHPIYHGVEESVLQIAIGHIEWSSLPIGGESTHSVLSGHRGLPSARLFTDLDKLVEGDTFVIRVLDETLTYQVDQIRIVEPQQIQDLDIVEGKDYCTLVTCTPYGINSHRLLVRGTRIENQAQAVTVRVTADAMLIEPVLMAPLVAVPMLLLLLLVLLVTTRKKR